MAPPPRLTLFLGPDESTATASARALVASLGDAERIDITPAQIRADPLILATEAASASLFAAARVIRVDVAGPGDECVDGITALLAAPVAVHSVVIVAGGATARGRLAKAATGPHARVVPCETPSPADLARIALAEASARHCRIDHPVAEALVAMVDGDQGLLVQELEKLSLYLDAGPGRERQVDLAAVHAVGAAMHEEDQDRLIDAILSGRTDTLPAELQRLSMTGVNPITFIRSFGRRVATFLRMAGGGRAYGVPPAREPGWREQLRLWPVADLIRLNGRLLAIEAQLKRPGTPGPVLLHQMLVDVARLARRRADRLKAGAAGQGGGPPRNRFSVRGQR